MSTTVAAPAEQSFPALRASKFTILRILSLVAVFAAWEIAGASLFTLTELVD